MTTILLLSDLEADEGVKLKAYRDTFGRWTIGVGHAGREVHPGLVWTVDDARAALHADVAQTGRGLDSALPWWRNLDGLRQDALANQAFNLGVHGLLEFKTFLAAMERGDWEGAAADDMHSRWAKQVGDRATRIAEQIRTGVHQPRPGALKPAAQRVAA